MSDCNSLAHSTAHFPAGTLPRIERLNHRRQNSDEENSWEHVLGELDEYEAENRVADSFVLVDPSTSTSVPVVSNVSSEQDRCIENDRGSGPSTGKLLDIDGLYVSPTDYVVGEQSMRLLLRDCTAFRFVPPLDREQQPAKTTLKAGSLLKPTCELDSDRVIDFLCARGNQLSDMLVARDCNQFDVYTVLSDSDTSKLSQRVVELLLPLKCAERIELCQDPNRLDFVEELLEGQRVDYIDESGKRQPGRVVARTYEGGQQTFQVEDMSGTSRIHLNAARLYNPHDRKNNALDARAIGGSPVVRNVEIKLIETGFEPDQKSPRSSFNADLMSWNGESFSSSRNGGALPRKDKNDHASPVAEMRRVPRDDHRSDRFSAPARSQSAHSGLALQSYSVSDSVRTGGAKVGDRVVWRKSPSQTYRATIQWIGHLRGHTSIYAGVEFDEAVGQGTGVYEGESLFRTSAGFAGFLLLSVLQREQDLPTPTYHPRNGRTKDERRAKQASAESLADSSPSPPPRPSKRNGVNGPPPLPPRPQMCAQDYLIESFGVGSCVEVWLEGVSRTGVVRWAGDSLSSNGDRLEKSAQVELECDVPLGWRLAVEGDPSAEVCGDPNRTVLVPQSKLRRDRRFEHTEPMPIRPASAANIGMSRSDFGSIDSGVETVPRDPCRFPEDLIGRMKGIQGNKNSCYLDATLYAMFVQSTSFDFLLERPSTREDIPQYEELRRILATEIVYPLRRFHFVRADHVMKMRELLAKALPGISGLTSEEKDPEEIMSSLFSKVFRAPPFLEILSLDNKIDYTHLCPIVVEHFSGGVVTTQHLLERSMREANVRFARAPRVLCLQMPRYGQQKLFDRILPLDAIDITALVNNAPVACARCGQLAEMHCPTCFLMQRVFITEVSHCASCFKEVHRSRNESDHMPRNYYPPVVPVKRATPIRMQLSAVISIEMSHYVSFVRAGSKWLFFDSMADRQGGQDGFNIPEVKECDKMGSWLSLDGWNRLQQMEAQLRAGVKNVENDALVTRIMSDSYICFYELLETPTTSSLSSVSTQSQSSTSGNLISFIKGERF